MRLSLLLVVPGLLISGILIWLQPWALESKLILIAVELIACLIIAASLHDHIIRPLQTLANVVGALREEDYSFRVRLAVPHDALGELSLEVNTLADLLAENRTGAMEATTLLQRVVEEVGIPIFAFDPAEALRLVNTAGERLLQQSSARLLGKTAAELGIQSCLTCENESLVPLRFNSDARWLVRRSSFRQQGVPHTLVILADVSRALREEERRAWQRLIRVMGHELNNSLAPIKSVAGSLADLVQREPRPPDWREDVHRGLEVISSRADSLARFIESYSKLARLPQPRFEPLNIGELVQRVATLETRLPVKVLDGPDIVVRADSVQLEQLLINLIRNAVDASLETNGAVEVGWARQNGQMIVCVKDEGLGLANTANLFVPFFSTKTSGSGIGLVLSRQIAEAHGGALTLENRDDVNGCEARLRLPL